VLVAFAPIVFVVMLFRGSVGHAFEAALAVLIAEALVAAVTDGFRSPR
jgi:hypothetical protein